MDNDCFESKSYSSKIEITTVAMIDQEYYISVLEPMIPMRVAINEGTLYREVVVGSTLKRNKEYANLYRELANTITERCERYYGTNCGS